MSVERRNSGRTGHEPAARFSDRGSRPAARAAAASLVLLLGACASPGPIPDPQLEPFLRDAEEALATPVRSGEPGGLIAVSAPTHTVRPEKREFSDALLARIQLPAGYRIGVFEQGLTNPRILHVSAEGHVYVTEREAGRVRLLRDSNGDGRADVSQVVASGLGEGMSGVHGLASRDGRLYMVTVKELWVAAIREDGSLGEPLCVLDDLPDGGQHPNRTIAFGPDGMLYVSVGSQTNAVPEPQEETAVILRVDPETWEREVYAEGLRNTIGFAWNPVSRELWGLDHNSDDRGDHWPPEELNLIREGAHYGWPWCGGNREVDWKVAADPDGESREAFCARTEAPALFHTAHAAPMQLAFYDGTSFPGYRGDAFATMRGSWNRNPPSGYEIVRIRFDEHGMPMTVEPFASGWLLDDGRAHIGRLTGLVVAPDGSLLVADDDNGVIYRIAWGAGG